MSDLSNDLPSISRKARSHRRTTPEYWLYLGLIFLVAVPGCTAIWAYNLIRAAKLPPKGPIQSALSEARTITPRIFWN